MPRRTAPAITADYVLLPADAYHGLQAFRDELIGIAQTIDPATTTPTPDARSNPLRLERKPPSLVTGPRDSVASPEHPTAWLKALRVRVLLRCDRDKSPCGRHFSSQSQGI